MLTLGLETQERRARTSGENLPVVLLTMRHPAQEAEPPANPAWLTPQCLKFATMKIYREWGKRIVMQSFRNSENVI